MNRQVNIWALSVILTLCLSANFQQISDFTYTQYTVESVNNYNKGIRLNPQRQFQKWYQFPKACDINTYLNFNLEQQGSLPKISNIDGQIQFLKAKVGEYLRLSNKAELLAKNIRQLPTMKNDPSLTLAQIEFQALEKYEKQLTAVNHQINLQAMLLQKIVGQIIKSQQNPLFKQASLSFQKKALEKKIQLFKSLQKASKEKKQVVESRNLQKLSIYFEDLKTIFDNQNDLVNSIYTLLQNHNQLAVLKAKIASLISQVKAHELLVGQKVECTTALANIKQRQTKDKEIHKLIETLKTKKRQFPEPNKFCQGVVQKLLKRVKKILIGYDEIYQCSLGLQQAKLTRDFLQGQLIDGQKTLDGHNMSKGVAQFRKDFQNNQKVLIAKKTQLQLFSIDQYSRNPLALQKAIRQSDQRIKSIDEELKSLPNTISEDVSFKQKQIQNKVMQIKRLKASYCQQNEKYTKVSKHMENVLFKLEQQEEYNRWLRKLQLDKIQELEQVKSRMGKVQTEIELHIRQK